MLYVFVCIVRCKMCVCVRNDVSVFKNPKIKKAERV